MDQDDSQKVDLAYKLLGNIGTDPEGVAKLLLEDGELEAVGGDAEELRDLLSEYKADPGEPAKVNLMKKLRHLKKRLDKLRAFM